VKLLVAEDEPELVKALKTVLEKQNYTIVTVTNGNDALSHATCGDYDGAVLDIMMPGMDGLQVLSRMRAAGIGIPVLLLTAKAEVEDRVAGLDAGADDYLPKPFAVSELLARVRAMLRRKGDYAGQTLAYGGVTLDGQSFELICETGSTHLSSREYRMMELMMDSPRRVIPTAQFIEKIWGWDSEVDVSIVWVNISNIRKKLQTIGAPVSIRAMRGVGYALEANE
jgi:DNA-binding response OmpR family regulator